MFRRRFKKPIRRNWSNNGGPGRRFYNGPRNSSPLPPQQPQPMLPEPPFRESSPVDSKYIRYTETKPSLSWAENKISILKKKREADEKIKKEQQKSTKLEPKKEDKVSKTNVVVKEKEKKVEDVKSEKSHKKDKKSSSTKSSSSNRPVKEKCKSPAVVEKHQKLTTKITSVMVAETPNTDCERSLTPPISFTPKHPVIRDVSVTPPKIDTSPFELKCRFDDDIVDEKNLENLERTPEILKESLVVPKQDEHKIDEVKKSIVEPSTTPPLELLKVEICRTPIIVSREKEEAEEEEDDNAINDDNLEDSPLKNSDIDLVNAQISDCFDGLMMGEKQLSPCSEEYTSKWEDECISDTSDCDDKNDVICPSADPILLTTKYEEFMKSIGDPEMSPDINTPILPMKTVRSPPGSRSSSRGSSSSQSSSTNSDSNSQTSSSSSGSSTSSSSESSDETSSDDDEDDDDETDEIIDEQDKESLLKKTLIKLMEIIPENCTDDLTKIDSANLKLEIRKLLDSDFSLLTPSLMGPPTTSTATMPTTSFLGDHKKVTMSFNENRKLNHSSAMSERIESTPIIPTPVTGMSHTTVAMAAAMAGSPQTSKLVIPNFTMQTQIWKISEHSIGMDMTPKKVTPVSHSKESSSKSSTPSSGEKSRKTESKSRRGPRTPSRDRSENHKSSRRRSPSPRTNERTKQRTRSRSRDRHNRSNDERKRTSISTKSSGSSNSGSSSRQRSRGSSSSSSQRKRSHSRSPQSSRSSGTKTKRSRSRRTRSPPPTVRSPLTKHPQTPPSRLSRSPRPHSRSPLPKMAPRSPLSPMPPAINHRKIRSPPSIRSSHRSRSSTPTRRSRSPPSRSPRPYVDMDHHMRPPSPKDMACDYPERTMSSGGGGGTWHSDLSSSGYGGSYPESPQRLSLDERIDIVLGITPTTQPPKIGLAPQHGPVVCPPSGGPPRCYDYNSHGYDYRPPGHHSLPTIPPGNVGMHSGDYRMSNQPPQYFPAGVAPIGQVMSPNHPQYLPRHFPPPPHPHHLHHPNLQHQQQQQHVIPPSHFHYQSMPLHIQGPPINHQPPPSYPPTGAQLSNIRAIPLYQQSMPPQQQPIPQPIPTSNQNHQQYQHQNNKGFTRQVGNCLEIIPSSDAVSAAAAKTQNNQPKKTATEMVETPEEPSNDRKPTARELRISEKERKRTEKMLRKVRLRLELEKIEEIWTEMYGSGVDHENDDNNHSIVVNSNGTSFMNDDNDDTSDEIGDERGNDDQTESKLNEPKRGIIRDSTIERLKKKRVLFSDGVQPGNGTSASDDDQQPAKKKKKKKKVRKHRSRGLQNKENNETEINVKIPPIISPLHPKIASFQDDEVDEKLAAAPPPPPPGSPPSHCIQPSLKNPPVPEFLYFHLNPIENRLIFTPYRPQFTLMPTIQNNHASNHHQQQQQQHHHPPPPLPPTQQQQQQPISHVNVLNLAPHQIRGITIDPALVRLIRSQTQISPQINTPPRN